MDSFDRTALVRLESRFDTHEIEALTFQADAGQPAQDVAVKVVDHATGTEVVCKDFPSQIKNKSIALIGLVERPGSAVEEAWNRACHSSELRFRSNRT